MRPWSNRWFRAVVSIAISAALWSWLVSETETAATIPVMIRYQRLPPDLEVTSEPPDRMFLKLKGPASRLRPESLRALALNLDLANVNAPGEQTITITGRELDLAPGVTLLRAVPSQVRVTLDRRGEKLVPVEVQYSGPPPRGYRVVSQRIFPDKVRVVGPEASIARIETAMTDRVDLSTTVGNSEFRVPVFLADPNLRLSGGSEFVTVQVTLERIPKS